MDAIRIEVQLPRNLLGTLNMPAEELGQKAVEWIALELFREDKISGGKAAEIMGLTKAQFIDFLNRRRIPYLDATPEELVEDMKAAS